MQISIGRMVFLSLLCLSLGALAIGGISVYGIQSFRQEFDRLVERDLPQASVATRLNAEISGLNSQVVRLTSAGSGTALDTIQIQTRDQLEAIDRLRDQLRGFDLRPGALEEINTVLNRLTSNLEMLTHYTRRKQAAERAFALRLDQVGQADAPPGVRLDFLLWLEDLRQMRRVAQAGGIAESLAVLDLPAPWRALGQDLFALQKEITGLRPKIKGRLTRHTQLASLLADSTRLMSSRLTTDAHLRSQSIQQQVTTSVALIFVGFLAFLAIGLLTYRSLKTHVVDRIRALTGKINAYEGHNADAPSAGNEITRIEASFTQLSETIAERESRLVALNAAATDARQDAEKANRSKSTLLAAASHDLRQPVHAMGLLIGAIDRKPLDRPSRDILDQLADLTRETAQLFNSILDLSKLESGTFTATRAPVDVADFLARVEREFGHRARLAGVRLVVTAPEDGLCLLGDSEALYRIIGNLLVNAIEYAGQGDITLDCLRDGKEAVFHVADQGPGLRLGREGAPATGQGSEDSGHKGYGLGLSISFALARAMKTELTFDLPEAGGTQFQLPLPLVTGEGAQRDPPPAQPTRPGSLVGLSVLLLEDNPDVQSATRDGLTRLGCDVTSCATADQARAFIDVATQRYMLITDMNLGRGHSAEGLVAGALSGSKPLIGVVVTTASPAKSITLWRDNDRVQVLEKPFSMGRLASLIRYISSRQGGH